MNMNMDPQNLHYNLLKAISPKMRIKEGEDLLNWQKSARERLIGLIGLDKIEKAENDCFNIEYKKDMGEYTDYRITFQSEEGYFVPCHLWVPSGKEGKIPVVICLQGHSTGAHISRGVVKHAKDKETISGGDRDFAVQIVKEGYCALSLEQRCFGECGARDDGYPGCELRSSTALLLGRTTVAERVFDTMRTIDLILEHFDFIDENAIGVMGNSGGGTATTYVGAIDTRVKVSMPSSALCTYKDSIGAMDHCICNYVPGIALDFDMGDLGGLMAPRGLIIVSGKEDPIFPDNGVRESFEVAKKYYELAGASDMCQWARGDEGHRFYAAISWPIFHEIMDK